MKQLLTLSFILISLSCFGQKKDTTHVSSNPIQLQRLDGLNKGIQEKQKTFNETLELILGVKIEDIESWGFNNKNGKFWYVLKQQKK